jgi:hypothetical protein
VRGKSKERLDEPAIIEGIRRELAEVIETVHENPLNIRIANRFRDFYDNGFALDFRRRKDIVAFRGGERFRRGSQIENGHTIHIESEGSGIRAQVIFGFIKGDQKTVPGFHFSGCEEMETESRLSGSRLSVDEVHPAGDKTSVKDLI